MDHKLVGKVISFVRKKQGKSMEELADGEISIGTISNIENGFESQKVNYLLSKLNIKDLDESINDYIQSRRILRFHLQAAENMVRYNAVTKETLKTLKLIKSRLEKNDPYRPWKKYLFGKYNQIKHPQTAMDYFLSAIALANENDSYDPNLNTISACYLSMAMIEYHANNLQKALEYVEKGIECFVDRGERQNMKYTLYFNKALFLIKSERFDEADIVIKKTWPNINKIDRMSVRLKLYQLKADVFRYRKEYQQAIDLIEEAIWLAMDNNLYNVSFTLWATLGEIVAETKHSKFTSLSFDIALSFGDKVSTPYLVDVYTDIAKHYIVKKDWDKAKLFIVKASDLVEKNNDKLKLINVFSVQGDMYFNQNNLTEASKHYEKARNLAHVYQLYTKEHQLLYKLIKCNKHNKKKQHELMEMRFELEERMEGVGPLGN